jgi:AcrR family transcriptional regulator
MTNGHFGAVSMARSDRQQREFQRREKEILDVALGLCSSADFESVTIEQIARGADVGKGTVYKHFASKDELLFRLNMRFYHGLLDELRAQTIAGTSLEKLERLIGYALQYHVSHREYRYVVEYCARIDFMERAEPAWRDDFLRLDQAFQEWGVPLIEQGMEAGVFARRPVERVLLGLHACFRGAITMLWAGEQWSPQGSDAATVSAAVTEFMLASLLGPGGTSFGNESTR